MARIILKVPYLKGSEKTAAHLSNLVKYIATRDGVEKMESAHRLWHSTKKQQELIAQILREFPDAKDLFEYEDYCENPNRGNASEFISIALEQNLDKISGREKYLDYIANRPRVEKLDSHGLFTAGDAPLVLSQVAEEVSSHTGNVWTPIISLRREDAGKFGFENAAAWKALLSSKAMELAENLKIHPDHLKWYAAFHNESHHPHVHMVCYSTDSREGYLTKQGIRKIKSALANEIFRQELIPLYGEKSQRREELKQQAAEAMGELIRQMKGGVLVSEHMEQLLTHLAERLQTVSGKKQYGYLKADLKNVVDEIVDELARDSRIVEAYRLWWEVRGRIEAIYTETPSDPPPLSRCEDFKPIRNMVIQEALNLGSGAMTFEEPVSVETALPDADSDDDAPSMEAPPENAPAEPEEDASEPTPEPSFRSGEKSPTSWWTEEYKLAKQYLHGDEDADIPQDFEKARELFLAEADKDNPLALYDLGRMTADGLGCEADADEAYGWYEKALAVFHAAEEEKPWKYTEYRIGKMVAAGLGTEQDYLQAADWLTLSANEKYKYAQYSLGGLYYHGKGVEQDHETAFALYTRSADQSFPYASFELGKMLRDGIGCVKNQPDADRRFKEAFLGFVSLEEKGHDDKLQYRLGWMLLNGVGTEKDEAGAKEYFEKAATVGNPFACYQLAKLILSDEAAPPQEVEKALGYLRQAVEAENPYASYFLGKLYEKGQHVPQNICESVRLYTLSAEQDNDFAAYRLGKLYLGGEGVLKDVETAIRWLTFAADRKNQFAEYALGVLYLKGEDVPKNVPKALEYLKRSAVQGNQYAQYRLGKAYMDTYLADENNLVAKAKAEKYAKITSKTIINASGENYGQNQFFYDAAEGLLSSIILLIAEYLPPTKVDGKKVDCRHIISVFKLVQDLLAPSKVKGKSQFQLLMEKLPPDHKARWFAGAALNSAEQAMASVLSTVLSRLNAFLDSEMEQILCFDTAIDAEKFCNEKSALFVVLPEEDLTKYFMVSLMIQQLYREILAVADENGGKLKNRVMFYCDELGTLPAIESLEMIFSASRSRRLSMIPIIQSFGQLEKNYGKEGAEIIVDNCQDTIFGGFAPNSQTAEVLSKAMGSRTVMSGSISRGKNDPSQSLQMMERPLMTPDELKSIPKGSFVVMKTGTHPMRTKLRLFLDWGIRFGKPYTVAEKANRKVVYADKQTLEENIVRKHMSCLMVDEETGEILEPPTGTGALHTPVAEPPAEPPAEPLKRRSHVRT